MLFQFDWPGNIRELQYEVERLSALSGERIEAKLLSPNILAKSADRRMPDLEGKSLKEIVARTVEDVEMQVIQSTLTANKWKKTKTAEALGISRPTLDSKIAKYSLRRDRSAGALEESTDEGGGDPGGNGESST